MHSLCWCYNQLRLKYFDNEFTTYYQVSYIKVLYLVYIHLCFVVLHRLLFLYCIVVIHQVCTGFYTVKNKEKLETVICYSHATVSVVAMCLSIFFFFQYKLLSRPLFPPVTQCPQRMVGPGLNEHRCPSVAQQLSLIVHSGECPRGILITSRPHQAHPLTQILQENKIQANPFQETTLSGFPQMQHAAQFQFVCSVKMMCFAFKVLVISV